MNTEGTALSRKTDPETSTTAATHVRGAVASRLESVVLDLLASHPQGLTSHEIAGRAGLSLVTVSPRIRPLIRKGLVGPGGVQPATEGRARTIWKAL